MALQNYVFADGAAVLSSRLRILSFHAILRQDSQSPFFGLSAPQSNMHLSRVL